jgi:WD40 repeat protein
LIIFLGQSKVIIIFAVLALATRQESENCLRIFDRFNQDCAQEVLLENFSGDVPGREVSCMAFSPDGIYLALARMDNSVHIYDSRMLSKGVMQKYQHEKPRFITKENHLCGVTHAQWVTKRSGQYAILSGGEDGINKILLFLYLMFMDYYLGCVRLWNPMWSSEEPSNGQKIIEAHSDIGHFSVGDPFKNEHDLVV